MRGQGQPALEGAANLRGWCGLASSPRKQLVEKSARASSPMRPALTRCSATLLHRRQRMLHTEGVSLDIGGERGVQLLLSDAEDVGKHKPVQCVAQR